MLLPRQFQVRDDFAMKLERVEPPKVEAPVVKVKNDWRYAQMSDLPKPAVKRPFLSKEDLQRIYNDLVYNTKAIISVELDCAAAWITKRERERQAFDNAWFNPKY